MARIGIHTWEKKCLQKLVFDIKLSYVHVLPISNTNSLFYLDYSAISKIIFDLMNVRHFFLIEDVAEIVSRTLIEKFSIICQVQIKVSKPGAIYNARNVSICINRNVENYLETFKVYIGWK